MRTEQTTSSCIFSFLKKGLAVLGFTALALGISGAALFAQETQAEDDEEDEPIFSSSAQTQTNRTFALIELGTILGGGLVWYNMDHSNEKDQLYDIQGSLANRFNGFNAWNYDSNLFETNYVSHPGAGMLYYLTGRANGYSKLKSYAFALGGSFCWEYFCEMQEVVSINDMIVTPFGGAAIGEPVYQLISHIGLENPCSISSLNRMSPYASRFPLGIGYGYNGKQYMTLSADYESINCDVVSPARSYSGFINDTMATRILINAAVSDNHIEYAYFHTQSMLAGFVSIRNRYKSNYSAGLVSGLNTAFTYEMHHYGAFMDKVGSAHLLGLSYATYMRKGDFYFLADGVAYFDFGSVNAYGLAPYLKSGHTMSDVAANGAFVTSINEYYFGVGNSIMVRLAAGYGKTSAAFEVNYLSYDSINTDGRTNREKATGKNFVMSDTRLLIKGTLSRQLIDEIAINASYSYRRIWGSASGVSRLGHESSYEMSLAYTGI